jgi:hypothetical protein
VTKASVSVKVHDSISATLLPAPPLEVSLVALGVWDVIEATALVQLGSIPQCLQHNFASCPLHAG